MKDKQQFADYFAAGEVPLNRPRRAAPPAVRPVTLPPYSGDFDASGYEDKRCHCHNGVSEKELRKLRKASGGRRLDLHGMTSEEAYRGIQRLLSGAIAAGVRVVEIVHGRGIHSASGGILRGKTRYWLCHCDQVLAYCEPPNNSGAVLVLLRSH